MPKLTQEQLDRARKMFLASADGVDAKRRIDALTQDDAVFMETSLDDLRAARTLDEISAFAHANRIEPAELLFSLASEDVDEFTRLCKAGASKPGLHLAGRDYQGKQWLKRSIT